MRLLHRLALAAAVTAVTGAGGILLGIVEAPTLQTVVEFCLLLFASVVISADVVATSATTPPSARPVGMMPPSFVFTFALLLRFGGEAAIVASVAGAVTSAIVQWRMTRVLDDLIVNSVTVIATIAAAIVYQTLGSLAALEGPWRIAIMALAAAA